MATTASPVFCFIALLLRLTLADLEQPTCGNGKRCSSLFPAAHHLDYVVMGMWLIPDILDSL